MVHSSLDYQVINSVTSLTNNAAISSYKLNTNTNGLGTQLQISRKVPFYRNFPSNTQIIHYKQDLNYFYVGKLLHALHLVWSTLQFLH